MSIVIATGVLDRLVRRMRTTIKISGINLRGQADFRADFVASILDGLLWQTSTIVFASVLLVRFTSVGDWASSAVLLLAAMRMTSHGLVTLVHGRVVFLNSMLVEGHLDTYLTRPMSVYRQVLLSRFNVNAFGDLLVGVTLLVFAVGWVDVAWTVPRVLLLVGGIVGGALVEAAVITVIAGTILIWPWMASWQFRFSEILGTVGNYPLVILPWAAQLALTFVLPIAFIAYLPAAAITGHAATTGLPAALVYGSPLVGVLLYVAARRIWGACLSRYQGANG